jgi:hypothetical protein
VIADVHSSLELAGVTVHGGDNFAGVSPRTDVFECLLAGELPDDGEAHPSSARRRSSIIASTSSLVNVRAPAFEAALARARAASCSGGGRRWIAWSVEQRARKRVARCRLAAEPSQERCLIVGFRAAINQAYVAARVAPTLGERRRVTARVYDRRAS